MKRIISFLAATCLVATSALAQSADYDEDTEANRQYVSWGIGAGPCLSGYRMHLLARHGGDTLSAQPAIGAATTAYFDYHISDRWHLRLACGPSLERVAITTPERRRFLTTFNVRIDFPVVYRCPLGQGSALAGLGPYSNFVVGSHLTGGTSPFDLQFATHPDTGEPLFAMDKWGSGLMLMLGYEWPSGWHLMADARIGLTNLLNFGSGNGQVLPYTVGLAAGYHFR